jgi:hypothetical protein
MTAVCARACLLITVRARSFFEEGSEAKIVHTLTDTSVVSAQLCTDGWSVTSLLLAVCSHPSYRALIDTGALITGMSNKQVAEFLLKHLDAKRVRGVVFLDDRDRKMVLVRTTMRAVELEDSGIGPEQRFAFYDQVCCEERVWTDVIARRRCTPPAWTSGTRTMPSPC